MSTSVRLENIEFSYGKLPVIRGITTDFIDGELVSIVGPNGAGKTTLLKIISGLIQPAQGKVDILGEQIGQISSKERGKLICSVPQNPKLPSDMKLIDFVLLGRTAHLNLTRWESDQDIQKAMTAMRLTDIEELAQRNLGQISGGELQRGMLAMAITQESPVMLLDEPTSNLDLSHQSKVLNLISKMHNEKSRTTIMAIHDLTLAAQYSTRMILISEGVIFADGKPTTLDVYWRISKPCFLSLPGKSGVLYEFASRCESNPHHRPRIWITRSASGNTMHGLCPPSSSCTRPLRAVTTSRIS